MIALISNLLKALAEFFWWRRVLAEMAAKRLALTIVQECEDETAKLDKEIQDLRKADDHVGADRLVRLRTYRAALSAGIPDLVKGPDLHSPESGDVGQPAGGAGKGSADTASSGGSEKTSGA